MHTRINLIDLRIVGDGFERHMRYGFVDEFAPQAFVRVFERIIVIARRHQPLLGQRHGYALDNVIWKH